MCQLSEWLNPVRTFSQLFPFLKSSQTFWGLCESCPFHLLHRNFPRESFFVSLQPPCFFPKLLYPNPRKRDVGRRWKSLPACDFFPPNLIIFHLPPRFFFFGWRESWFPFHAFLFPVVESFALCVFFFRLTFCELENLVFSSLSSRRGLPILPSWPLIDFRSCAVEYRISQGDAYPSTRFPLRSLVIL